jgi:hypothetical protein
MALPTLDQTEGIWIDRTKNQGYHYIQVIFPKDTYAEQAHRANCLFLIQRGSLQAESPDSSAHSLREWDATQRYHRVHI